MTPDSKAQTHKHHTTATPLALWLSTISKLATLSIPRIRTQLSHFQTLGYLAEKGVRCRYVQSLPALIARRELRGVNVHIPPPGRFVGDHTTYMCTNVSVGQSERHCPKGAKFCFLSVVQTQLHSLSSLITSGCIESAVMVYHRIDDFTFCGHKRVIPSVSILVRPGCGAEICCCATCK